MKHFEIIEITTPEEKSLYLNFIFDSWLTAYKHLSSFTKNIQNRVYFPNHRKLVSGVIAKENTRILIAHPPEDKEVILGYFVFEKTPKQVAHFVFVKEAFRENGLAKALFQGAGFSDEEIFFTHWTYAMNAIVYKRQNFVFNPYGVNQGVIYEHVRKNERD